MSDNPPRRTGAVTPVVRTDAHVPVEAPLRGIPLFNRMHYRAVRKELDEYLGVLDRKEAIIRKLDAIAEASEQFAARLVRAERWDELRAAEHSKIDAELTRAHEGAVQAYREVEVNAFAHRARKANAEADAIAAERRLEGLRNPPAPPAPPPKMTTAERVDAKVAEIREREAALIAAVAGDSNEAGWPDEVKELVADIRLATRNHLSNLVDDYR